MAVRVVVVELIVIVEVVVVVPVLDVVVELTVVVETVVVLVVVVAVVVEAVVVVVVVSSGDTPMKNSPPTIIPKSLFCTTVFAMLANLAFFKVMRILILPRTTSTPRKASLGRPALAMSSVTAAVFTASRSAVSKSA